MFLVVVPENSNQQSSDMEKAKVTIESENSRRWG